MGTQDVVVIGAGPYGLAAAAHLRAAGVAARVFGEPMAFWARQMPAGMLLRSYREASHIAGPGRTLTLDDYEAACGAAVGAPVPLERFVAYGRGSRVWSHRSVTRSTSRGSRRQVTASGW